MIERYAVVAGRIRHELSAIERVVDRAERAVAHARKHPDEQDFYMDSAALNLHDFYAGIERIFQNIAAHVDRDAPAGSEWHRELLRQMSFEVPGVRPAVLLPATAQALDEYLRFRHVVRNVYAFEFDAQRIIQLAESARDCFEKARADLLRFADFLAGLARADEQG